VKGKSFVVIHEEDDLIRELLERWLDEAGYDVAIASPRQKRQKAPCLVIANVASPRNAQPLLESLRAVYAAPVLALSGRFRRGLEGSAEAACRLGVRKVLPKPFTREELLSAVDEALDGAA